jgi:glutamate--cysteine ligase
VYQLLERRLALIDNSGYSALLREGKKGVETETLRITPDNRLAQTPHPAALGSSLTNPLITTDFSESQLEFVTPPFTDVADILRVQSDVRRFTNLHLDGELLWPASMPCIVSGEESVPIAQFGPSNQGRFKHVYRNGLAARYRRIMQIICGVHYNYSVAEAFWPVYQQIEHDPQPLQSFVSDAYFALSRNAQRFDWLITYLFGCSPALCKSFMDKLGYPFPEHDTHSLYELYATSLRLSNIGYKNQESALLNVSYDSLDAYVSTLYHATRTSYPPYEALGIYVDGDYRQLNANLLQFENEYYGSIRPKRVPQYGERPLAALARGGVQYVELRSLDVNAFDPTGVNEEELRFLEAFLLFCMLQESPTLDIRDKVEAAENQTAVAHRGRQPGLTLRNNGQEVSLHDWASTIMELVAGVGALLDAGLPDTPYTNAIRSLRESIDVPERTPSARVLREMEANNETFFQFGRRMADQHREQLTSRPLSPDTRQYLNEVSDKSRRDTEALESESNESFEAYVAGYLGQRVNVQADHDNRAPASQR